MKISIVLVLIASLFLAAVAGKRTLLQSDAVLAQLEEDAIEEVEELPADEVAEEAEAILDDNVSATEQKELEDALI